METVKSEVGNGNVITYKIVNGVAYHVGIDVKDKGYDARETPQAVVDVLESARASGQRIRVHYGDENGRDWLDEYDVAGRVSNSMGPLKVPLLIHSSRSYGGSAMLDQCIVKITTTTKPKRVLYQQANYQTPNLTKREIVKGETVGKVDLYDAGYRFAVDRDGEGQANFKTEKQADRYISMWK